MNRASLDNLLAAFLAGPWTEASMVSRAKQALGKSYRQLPAFVRRLLFAFPTATHSDRIAAFVDCDEVCGRIWKKIGGNISRQFFAPAFMAPHPAAASWDVPPITTDAMLCELLHIDMYQLSWLADLAGRNHREVSAKLHHYRYRWLPKADGQSRLLEIPKPMLKDIQSRILHLILDKIPPHTAAHAFRVGCSIKSNAEIHTGREMVMRFDLKDFFPSVGADAASAVFRTAGYPPEIAKLLVGLCTTRLPRAAWETRPNAPTDGSDHPKWLKFHARHLPQGSPSSPSLANLAAFHLDCRLHALAAGLDLRYTRYADDLTFSGGKEFAASTDKFARGVSKIVNEEGFRLNDEKTRVMPRSGQQRVAGVVVNVRPTVPRAEYDRLKAILTNCVRSGPESQNREGHPNFRAYLTGKISHIAHLNPTRGRKLLSLFDRIQWHTAKHIAE